MVFNGGLYFPQWLVVDNHVSDLWYNSTLVLTTVLLLSSAPALGLLSDTRFGRLFFLRLTSIVMFLGTVMLFVADHFVPAGPLKVTLALLAFISVLYSYQLSLVFHNALLARVSTPESYTLVSGKGLAWGWVGAIFGIVATFPFVNGNISMFPPGRGEAFLPSALIFGLLAVISLKYMPDDVVTQNRFAPQSMRGVYRALWKDIRDIRKTRTLFVFLMAYLIYSDVVLTIEDNSTIYLEQVMHFSDTTKALLYVLLLVTGAIGAVGSGYVSSRLGHVRSLVYILTGWMVVLVAVVSTDRAAIFYVLFGIVGLLFGSLLNVSRVIYVLLAPPTRRAELFGIYASFERSASLLGPLVWSAPIVLLPGLGAMRYRIAMSSMAVLIAISLILARRVGRVPDK